MKNQDPFCTFCLKKFINPEDCRKHIKMIHEKAEEGKFCCKFCNKSYMSKIALEYHFDIMHGTKDHKVKCMICGTTFGHTISWNRHMKIHSEKTKVHKCKMCPKEFNRKDILTLHVKVVHHLVDYEVDMAKIFRHDSESFKCKICDKIFTGDDADTKLSDHLIDKCREKAPYQCDECTKKFSTKFNVEYHKTISHSELTKNFSCENCDFVTKHQSILKRHVRRVHT